MCVLITNNVVLIEEGCSALRGAINRKTPRVFFKWIPTGIHTASPGVPQQMPYAYHHHPVRQTSPKRRFNNVTRHMIHRRCQVLTCLLTWFVYTVFVSAFDIYLMGPTGDDDGPIYRRLETDICTNTRARSYLHIARKSEMLLSRSASFFSALFRTATLAQYEFVSGSALFSRVCSTPDILALFTAEGCRM